MNLFRVLLMFVPFFLTTAAASPKTQHEEKFLFGCFFTESRCPNENVTFHFYTQKLQDTPLEINLHQLDSDIFLPNRPLIVLIHGYTGHRDDHPNPQLREAFFARDEDFNIISVDYEHLAPSPCYIHAVANLPTVANCTANLIDLLLDRSLFTLDDIHVIGFSLGAQTAGMIANYLSKSRKLKRITGLDPAKPLFITAPVDRRLDESDAEFVDVLHTDVFFHGVLMSSGHVDFYANGGYSQPGCHGNARCNHLRAPQYYAESINSEIGFWGFGCDSWFTYALGFCHDGSSNATKARFGYAVNNGSRGVYIFETNAVKPYAMGSSSASDDGKFQRGNYNPFDDYDDFNYESL